MNLSSVRIAFLALTLAVSVSAQSEPATSAPAAPSTASPSSDSAAPSTNNGDRPGRNRRGNFSPADLQARLLQNLREQMAVKDDAEWTLISERITAIVELRRSAAPNLGFAFGGGRGGGNAITANPELDALRAALTDNLPDSEITARLAKLRESRKQIEARLDQARESLRAVLTPRQEAVAVMTGLLN